jgi:potassium-transporting ATPase ATP-binding subunit
MTDLFASGGVYVKRHTRSAIFDRSLLGPAISASFRKLDPRTLVKNPVMFCVEIVSVLTTIFFLRDLFVGAGTIVGTSPLFSGQIAAWLWFTVLFANFAEAVAEGRGKAQADALRRTRTETIGKLIESVSAKNFELVPATELKAGDLVLVEAGDLIPSDGDVVEGVASVDESAITGESAPVIREAGGDRSAVTGGTRVTSDWLKVRITAAQGATFLDRMIALVEGAVRQKTPNEIALNILLAGMTLIFVFATVTIPSFASYAKGAVSVVVLIALFVCLIPTTIGALLSAIGIAGMDRLVRFNVLAMSGRAVEAAGDVDTLLLDKTGTITLGNRQATEFIPLPGVDQAELVDAAQLASLSDETPEGRSIVVLAKEKYGLRGRDMTPLNAKFVPFSAQTRMSGIDLDGTLIRKGAVDSVIAFTEHVRSAPVWGSAPRAGQTLASSRAAVQAAAQAALHMGPPSEPVREAVAIGERIAKEGGTPLAVARDDRILGIIHLKDIVKGGIRERFAELRRMGMRTVMITGDNPLTAAAIAAESGVDDFLAQATPEDKLKLIREEQAKGKLVAMCGDGTNDAPALAQADVGVAMNTGTMAAREAGNMVDLDSDPTKLIEIVAIGKQLLITRGALTTFSIANDVAKYFAIIPAMFAAFYPQLNVLNVMRLHSPESAILSAIVFNALIIIALIPLALKGVRYRPIGAAGILRRSLLIYGIGGIVAPFIGIKLIDLAVTAIGLA